MDTQKASGRLMKLRAAVRAFVARVRKLLGTPRGRVVEHVVVVFVSASVVDAAGNAFHVFRAHGLDGLKAAGYGIAAAAVFAGYQAVRPLVRQQLVRGR